MKRVIQSGRNITRHYAQNPPDRLRAALGISSWGDSDSLSPVSEGKWNFKIASRYEKLNNESGYISRLKEIGAKYVTIRYGQIYFYFDTAAYTQAYNDEEQRFEDEYNSQLDAIDIDQYRPSASILKKLSDYRAKGSIVNVKAIKDPVKLLTYYYGAELMGWRELQQAIFDIARIDYADEISAISRRVSADPSMGDTRSDMDIELGLSDSHGLFTFDGRDTWLPKSILQFFVQNNVPVHFGKRTSGGRYDHNGAQWTEVEHLTLFPDDNPVEYDIAVHTNERADGSIPNTYTAVGRTDERVSAKKIIDDLADVLSSHESVEGATVVASDDARTYEDVLGIIEKAFDLKHTNLFRYRHMIHDIQGTAGKLDASTIFNFFANHNSVYDCEDVLDQMDTACRDKVIEYAKKWGEA